VNAASDVIAHALDLRNVVVGIVLALDQRNLAVRSWPFDGKPPPLRPNKTRS
jgi:hypothetical protein